MAETNVLWHIERRRRQKRLHAIHAKLDKACADAIAIYREPIMVDSLSEKLKLVAEESRKRHLKVHARADAFLARGPGFDAKIDQSFGPHEQAMDAAEKDMTELEKKLDQLTNSGPAGPLPE